MGAMGLPETQRNEFLERRPYGIGREAAKHLLGGWIEDANLLTLVNRDDRVHGGLNDAVQPRCALPLVERSLITVGMLSDCAALLGLHRRVLRCE